MTSNIPILNFKNIHAHYGAESILENINLRIEASQHWVILGANGSGKSSLIKLITNELYPDPHYEYVKEVFGRDRWHVSDLRNYFGIITNDLHTYFYHFGKHVRIYDAVLSGFYSSVGVFPHQEYEKVQHEKVREVLDVMDIGHLAERTVAKVSTGELRRAIVARALIHDPKAFILDEPTVGLDIKAQYEFIEIMRKLSKRSSIILITHHIEEIFPEIAHAALIYNRSIFKKGKKEDALCDEHLSTIFEMDIHLYEKNGRYLIKTY